MLKPKVKQRDESWNDTNRYGPSEQALLLTGVTAGVYDNGNTETEIETVETVGFAIALTAAKSAGISHLPYARIWSRSRTLDGPFILPRPHILLASIVVLPFQLVLPESPRHCQWDRTYIVPGLYGYKREDCSTIYSRTTERQEKLGR